MINGFEIITDELSAEEKLLIPGFVASFKKRIGKDKSITAAQIIAGWHNQGVTITGPRVRAIIHYLRDNWIVPGLVATSIGYYITEDPEDIREYIESLKQRNKSVEVIITRMEEYLQQLLKTQDHG